MISATFLFGCEDIDKGKWQIAQS